MKEFEITPENTLPVGYMLTARHFVVGQYVDVHGKSKGKGFQGAMKRWHFSGGPASHGATKWHRRVGAIGQRTYPGKIWKGKKMPGRMGGKPVAAQSLQVIKIDYPRSLIYVRGGIPGPIGSTVYVQDSVRRMWKQYKRLKYPTFIPKPNQEYPDQFVIKPPLKDPSEHYKHENNLEGIQYQNDEIDDVAVDETGTIIADDEAGMPQEEGKTQA